MSFDDFEEFEKAFNEEIDKDLIIDDRIDYSLCENCKIGMSVMQNRYVCEKCGWSNPNIEVSDHTSIASDNSYNVTSNGIRCVGLNAHRYQKILRSCAEPNDAHYEILLGNVLFGYRSHTHVESERKPIQIPKTILFAVADQYRHIRAQGHSARGTIFRAILAAFTYYECLKCNLGFKPEDIYLWFGIDPSTYSKGDKKVRELLDHGHLDTNIREVNPFESFLITFSKDMDLDETQLNLVKRIMEYVTKNNIVNPNAKASTRAYAVLNFFAEAIGRGIGYENFEKRFGCNYGTIRQMTHDIMGYRNEIAAIFSEFNIECPGLITPSSKNLPKRKLKKGARISITL